MNRAYAPQEVVDLAHARREARAERDWVRADALKAEIEAAGWTVVDRGVDFELRPAVPPDVIHGGVTHFGASISVPSRLDEPASIDATIVVVARDPAALGELGVVAVGGGRGVEIVIVAEAADDKPVPARVDADVIEVIHTANVFSVGAARNAGLRRCRGTIAIVVDPTGEGAAAADGPGPAKALEWLVAGGAGRLERTLSDPTVAIVGVLGYRSADLRRFDPDGGGSPRPVAVGGPVVAFRRADLIERGPLDERFLSSAGLDIWWSLVLRDEGERRPPRRAVTLGDGPPEVASPLGPADRRLPRRDTYRLAERFAGAEHLLVRDDTIAPPD